VSCESAEQALGVFRSLNPRLVVSDLSMAGMGGLGLIESIRDIEQKENRPAVAAIALTALASQRDSDAARKSGFDAHLSKPIDPDALIDAARSLLNGRKP
jgi:hypothetical protein